MELYVNFLLHLPGRLIMQATCVSILISFHLIEWQERLVEAAVESVYVTSNSINKIVQNYNQSIEQILKEHEKEKSKQLKAIKGKILAWSEALSNYRSGPTFGRLVVQWLALLG